MPRSTLLPLLLLLIVPACNRPNNSGLQGHYEDMDRANAEALAKTKPRVIEEHGSVDFVAISSTLVSTPDEGVELYTKTNLATSILKAGAGLTIMVGKDHPGNIDSPDLKEFKQATKGFHDRIRFVKTRHAAPGIWARDWAPLLALNEIGEKILLDFNYYRTRAIDDNGPTILAESSPQSKRLSVPVYNEGGNFMNNARGVCMMTSRVIIANTDLNESVLIGKDGNPIPYESSEDSRGDTRRDEAGRSTVTGSEYYDLDDVKRVRLDDKDLTKEEIIDYYKRYAGCKEVHIFDKMPIEDTGHIDMFAKFLDDDTILINEISAKQIDQIKDAKEKKAAKEMKDYLDKTTKQISSLGFKLLKVPMPVPQVRTQSFDTYEHDSFVTRSYTNSLIINRGGKKVALVPRYTKARVKPLESSTRSRRLATDWEQLDKLDPIQQKKRQENYSDHDLIAGYEKATREAYKKAGYETVFIDSDDLISDGGAVHCVTMQFAYPL